MFDKKTKDPSATSTSPVSKAEMGNIFDELGNLDFWPNSNQEVPQKTPKDKIYYMRVSSNILISLNIFIFFILLLIFVYINVENNAELKEVTYLDPVCSILLGSEVGSELSPCSSVTAMIAKYQADYQTLSSDLSQKTLKVAEDLYKIQNFANSPEVQFVVNNKNNKLKVLDVMNAFDLMKNDFAFALWDKNSLECDSISMSKDYTMDISCIVYSRGWDEPDTALWRGIVSGEWNTKILTQGTSISVASSFINFIEKNPSYKFTVVEKQKQFTNSTTVDEGMLTKQTTLQMKLKYDNFENNLSL